MGQEEEEEEEEARGGWISAGYITVWYCMLICFRFGRNGSCSGLDRTGQGTTQICRVLVAAIQ